MSSDPNAVVDTYAALVQALSRSQQRQIKAVGFLCHTFEGLAIPLDVGRRPHDPRPRALGRLRRPKQVAVIQVLGQGVHTFRKCLLLLQLLGRLGGCYA